jgi:RND family efflux transporter MFP subunit
MANLRSLALILAAAAALALCAGNAQTESLSSRGITEPLHDAKVSATVGGTVVAIRVKEGQTVKAGDPVFELDNDLEALEVERRKLIADSTVEVDAARSRMETLAIDLEGTRKLHEQTKSVSAEDLRKKELEYRLAQADLDRLLVSQQREQIEYRIAVAQKEKKTVAAPFDGVIVQLMLEVGESATQQQPLFRIVDAARCRLVVHMEQAPSLKLKPGSKVGLKIQEADGPVTVRGSVDFISPLVDASSGLREVKVVFDNPDGRVHPGVAGVIASER